MPGLVQQSLEYSTPKKPELFSYLMGGNFPLSREPHDSLWVHLQICGKLVQRHQYSVVC
jgi:hypothetical protein